MQQPLVSIICITFNHEAYISQALERFLIQKTKFKYEILIGDDCSTDNTRQICLEYLYSYPDLIRLIANERNLGPFENFKRSCLSAQGQFLAFCDGDDYWTDPLKLQKQVDFLEKNLDFSIVHTNKNVLLNNEIYLDKPIKINSGKIIEDLLCTNTLCISTVMARSDIFNDTLKRIASLSEGRKLITLDYAFWLDIALDHKIGFLNDVTGVYRLLPESLSHSLNPYKVLSFVRCEIDVKEFYFKEYLKMNPNVNNGFKLRFKENVFHLKKRLLLDYGFVARGEIFSLMKINPLVYFYIIYKKLKNIINQT